MVIIGGIGAISSLSWLKFQENARWVVHTRKVLETSETLVSSLKDAETGQRGYLLTGKRAYLEPFIQQQARRSNERQNCCVS